MNSTIVTSRCAVGTRDSGAEFESAFLVTAAEYRIHHESTSVRAVTLYRTFVRSTRQISAADVPIIDEVAVDQQFVVVLTTLGSDIDPATVAMRLVEERLAACVNVLPEMESFFRWHGAVERDRERQLLIKTRAALVPELQKRLLEMHPYELPEFLVLPVAGGSEAYLKWITGSTTDPDVPHLGSDTRH